MHPSIFMLPLLALAILSSAFARPPTVTAVKRFSGIYPASASLQIPFHGCVALESPLPPGDGEYWLNLDHLIQDDDYAKIEVLVNAKGTILGARAVFKGTEEEWKGSRGLASRQKVLRVFCLENLSNLLPLAYDGREFGGMVYTFDGSGHVSWRNSPDFQVTNEEEYVASMEKHKRGCEECKDMNVLPQIVLSINPHSEPSAAPNGP